MIIKTSYPFMKPPPSARLIRGHRLAQGLVGLWTMPENGGFQVFDLSENSLHGACINTTWTADKFGSALNFVQANTAYVDIGDPTLVNALLETSQQTLIIWLNISAVTQYSNCFGKNNPGDDGFSLQVVNDTSPFRFHMVVTGSPDTTSNSVYVPENELHCIAGVCDDATVRIYLDGVGTVPVSLNSSVEFSTRKFTIGGDSRRTRYNTLQCSLASVYNRALSASEIAEVTYRPFCMLERRARTALMSGYEVVAPPTGIAVLRRRIEAA